MYGWWSTVHFYGTSKLSRVQKVYQLLDYTPRVELTGVKKECDHSEVKTRHVKHYRTVLASRFITDLWLRFGICPANNKNSKKISRLRYSTTKFDGFLLSVWAWLDENPLSYSLSLLSHAAPCSSRTASVYSVDKLAFYATDFTRTTGNQHINKRTQLLSTSLAVQRKLYACRLAVQTASAAVCMHPRVRRAAGIYFRQERTRRSTDPTFLLSTYCSSSNAT